MWKAGQLLSRSSEVTRDPYERAGRRVKKTHPFRTQLWRLKRKLAFRKVRARLCSLPALCVSTCLFPAASDCSECLCLQVLRVTLRDAANVQGAFAQVLLVMLECGLTPGLLDCGERRAVLWILILFHTIIKTWIICIPCPEWSFHPIPLWLRVWKCFKTSNRWQMLTQIERSVVGGMRYWLYYTARLLTSVCEGLKLFWFY